MPPPPHLEEANGKCIISKLIPESTNIQTFLLTFCFYKIVILQAEVLQVIYKEYTFDEFVDFSNSTFEMNWKVNNLLSELQNVSGRLKVSWNF